MSSALQHLDALREATDHAPELQRWVLSALHGSARLREARDELIARIVRGRLQGSRHARCKRLVESVKVEDGAIADLLTLGELVPIPTNWRQVYRIAYPKKSSVTCMSPETLFRQ